MRAHLININILQIFAPTTGSNEEFREHFYTDLESLTKNVKKHKFIIVIGNLNAKIGKERFEDIVGV